MLRTMIYMHIGTPKTGTTTVQKSFWENRQALAKAGWLYPQTGCVGFGHHSLARALTGTDFPGLYEKLYEEIRAAGLSKVILSSEVFATLLPEEIQALKEKLAGYQVRVIVYLRRQDEFIYSHWAQGVKYMTVAASFDQWVDMRIASPRNINNYDKLMNKWSAAFGQENIMLRVFDRSHIPDHIFYDVLRACDVPTPTQFPYCLDENVSPDVKTIEIIRTLNEKSGFSRNPSSRKFAHLLGNLILDYYASRRDVKKSGSVISPDVLEKIRLRYEEGNRRVAQEYLDRETLFEYPAPGPVSTYDISELSGAEALDMFAYVLPQLFERLEKASPQALQQVRVEPALSERPIGWMERTRRKFAKNRLLDPLRWIYHTITRSKA